VGDSISKTKGEVEDRPTHLLILCSKIFNPTVSTSCWWCCFCTVIFFNLLKKIVDEEEEGEEG